LDNLDDNVDNNWESIRENMKASAIEILGYYELQQYNHDLIKSAQN